jgi:hypothetical protein
MHLEEHCKIKMKYLFKFTTLGGGLWAYFMGRLVDIRFFGGR